LFPPTEYKTEWSPLWHNWGNRGRIASGAEHPYRTRLLGCISKMGEALGTLHTRGRVLFLGW
jgi:hypothetical protein